MIVTKQIPVQRTVTKAKRLSKKCINTTSRVKSESNVNRVNASISSSSDWPTQNVKSDTVDKDNDFLDTVHSPGKVALEQRHLKQLSSSITPIAILGGTASVYSKALGHSSSTLSPLSALYLLLLALQYAIMPRLSKKFIHPKTNSNTIALTEELFKFAMGIVGFVATQSSKTQLLYTAKNWTFMSSIWAAGLPSALYALQGVLTYTAYRNLDGVTFNGLTQFKTLSAALCCYIVLGKRQSTWQMVALSLLFFSTLLFQGTFQSIVKIAMSYGSTRESDGDIPSRSSFPLLQRYSKQKLSGLILRVRNRNVAPVNQEATSSASKNHILWGIVPCLTATLLSGLAGSFSQKSLQTASSKTMHVVSRDAYLYSAEISFFSALCLIGSMVYSRQTVLNRISRDRLSRKITRDHDSEKGSTLDKSVFQYWSWGTFIPIVVKAAGGILTALVHKHSGSVMKGFSLVLGLVLSGVLQQVLDGKDLSFTQLLGTVLVLLSSWLHFTNPTIN